MDFGDRIKERRIQIGATLEEIGKSVGVTKATVQRWESGLIENVRMDKIVPLADALKTSVGYLIGVVDGPEDSYSFDPSALDMAFREYAASERTRTISFAETELLCVVDSICADSGGISPKKIQVITEFLQANDKILKALMSSVDVREK